MATGTRPRRTSRQRWCAAAGRAARPPPLGTGRPRAAGGAGPAGRRLRRRAVVERGRERRVSELALSPFREGLAREVAPPPCTVVIFGATGDLAHRKLAPALYKLMLEGVLPVRFAIVGFARGAYTDAGVRRRPQAARRRVRARAVRARHLGRLRQRRALRQRRVRRRRRSRAEGARSTRSTASAAPRGNRLFYLATPPSVFPVMLQKLAAAGPARRGGRRLRARDRREAVRPRPRERAALNAEALSGRARAQIFRIDHYLGKETVQNILVFRFGNAIFEPLWNRSYVDHVQITVGRVDRRRGRAARSTRRPARCATSSRTTCSSSSRSSAMEPPASLRRRRRPRREGEGAARRCAACARREVAEHVVRGQYARGLRRRRAGAGLPRGAGRRAGLAAPRPTSRCSSTSTTGAGRACRSTCAPASACRSASPRSRSTSSSVPHVLFSAQPDAADRAERARRCASSPTRASRSRSSRRCPARDDARSAGDHGLPLRQRVRRRARPRPTSACCSTPCCGDATLFIRARRGRGSRGARRPRASRRGPTQPAPHSPNYEAGTWGPEAADALLARDGREWRRP